MQRKKFLALMLTAALVGQPGAPVSIMAAETDESSDFGSFGSEASDTAEKKLPVITEDLSEETITYDLNEKAEPLKVQTEESGKLKYLWLKSDDNENFYKIEKSDSQEKTKEEQTGEQQGENSQPEYEDTQEYTPATDTAGTFYYKVRIWNSEETDENAYVESKTVCLQVLDPSAEDHSGLDATDGKKDGEQKDPAALDKEDPAADHTSGDTAENSGTKKMRIRTAKIPEVKTVEMRLMTGKIPAMKLVRTPVTKRTIPENLVVRTSEMKILPLKIPIKKTRISPKTIPRIIFPNVRKTSRKVKLTKPKVTGTYLSVRSFRIRTEMI